MSDQPKLTAEMAETGSDVLVFEGERIVGQLTEFESLLKAIDLMARINASVLPTPHLTGEISAVVGCDFGWDWAQINENDTFLCLVNCKGATTDAEIALAKAIVKQVKGENSDE